MTWRAIGTHQALAVYDDRTAWYWAMATIGPGSELVGSFRDELAEDHWAAVSEVATLVPTLARTSTGPVPGELGLRVGSGPESAWLPLAEAAAARVTAVTERVLPLVRRHPVAAAGSARWWRRRRPGSGWPASASPRSAASRCRCRSIRALWC